MTKLLSLLSVALVAFAALMASSDNADARGRRGVGIGLGIGAAVVGAIILSEAARAEGYRRGPRCRRLIAACDDGEGWACRKFHRECE